MNGIIKEFNGKQRKFYKFHFNSLELHVKASNLKAVCSFPTVTAWHVPKCFVINSNGANCNMKLIFLLFFLSFHAASITQNEISEVFDKLHHVNGNHDSAIEVNDTVDSRESLKPVVKDIKPSLRKLNDAVKSPNIEEWNSLAQFETFIKLEMENLAAAKNHQKSNGTTTVSMKSNNNILKPEKHVSRNENDSLCLLFENDNHTPESRMKNVRMRKTFYPNGLFH
jgi:hypothetical protein